MREIAVDLRVVATGKKYTVRYFAEIAFGCLGLDWKRYVEIDPTLYRPAEVDALCGNASLIREELGWKPTITLEALIEEMVQNDLSILSS